MQSPELQYKEAERPGKIHRAFLRALNSYEEEHPGLIDKLSVIKNALREFRLSDSMRVHRIDEWITALVSKHFIMPEEQGMYLDIVSGICDSLDFQKIIKHPGSALHEKLQEKMLQYRKNHIGNQDIVETILFLLQTKPITFDRESQLESWLEDCKSSGLLEARDFNKCLDVLTSET